MRTTWLRSARLEVKAALLHLGIWPWVGMGLFLVASWLQEPRFFRQQQLDLAWPAVAACADILSLVYIKHILTTNSRRGFQAASRMSAALLTASLAFGGCALLGLGLDVLIGAPTPWPWLAAHAARFALLWPAVCAVAASPRLGTGAGSLRTAWVLAAFAVQSSLLPLDVPIWERSSDSWLAIACTLAAGSTLLTSPRQPSARGELPCA